jgi:hypothetical protein
MPRLRRLATATPERAPDVIWTYVIGVDMEDPQLARSWPRYRAEAWKQNLRRDHFPLAAAAFDGFTARCFRELERREGFDFHRFETALADDRTALQGFRDRHPKAAATIRRWLDEFAEDLDLAHGEASARADGQSWSVPGRDRVYEADL